jgi:hypothetical protein
LQKEANEIVATLRQEPADSVRSISNVDGTSATMGNIQVLMNLLPESNKYVVKRGVIGATGARWNFISTFNRLTGRAQLRDFKSLQQALNWIVEE